jgi:hypothetical protein
VNNWRITPYKLGNRQATICASATAIKLKKRVKSEEESGERISSMYIVVLYIVESNMGAFRPTIRLANSTARPLGLELKRTRNKAKRGGRPTAMAQQIDPSVPSDFIGSGNTYMCQRICSASVWEENRLDTWAGCG